MNKLAEKTRNLGRGIKNSVKGFWNDESGMGTVEVILIIVEIYIFKRYVYHVFSIPKISIFLQ